MRKNLLVGVKVCHYSAKFNDNVICYDGCEVVILC